MFLVILSCESVVLLHLHLLYQDPINAADWKSLGLCLLNLGLERSEQLAFSVAVRTEHRSPGRGSSLTPCFLQTGVLLLIRFLVQQRPHIQAKNLRVRVEAVILSYTLQAT